MKHLLDFSMFIFKCFDFKKNKVRFTYKTNKENFYKIYPSFIENLKEISKIENFYTKLSKNKSDHEIKEIYIKNKIGLIFEHNGYNAKWIDQNIIEAPIYQKKFNNAKNRLVYIFDDTEREKNIIAIKPLFLDLNHSLYPNNSLDNSRYENCLICHNNKCKI